MDFQHFWWNSLNFTYFHIFWWKPGLFGPGASPAREHQRNLWNSIGFWGPIGLKSIGIPCGWVKCQGFHKSSWRSVISAKSHKFREMSAMPWRAPQNHQYSLGNIDVSASGAGKLGFHQKYGSLCKCCHFSINTENSVNSCFCGENAASPAPTRNHQYSLGNIDDFEVPFTAKSAFAQKPWVLLKSINFTKSEEFTEDPWFTRECRLCSERHLETINIP